MAEAASIIEAFKHFLAEEVKLTLINIYKEVPVVHRASICDVRGEQLVLETEELQICAMHCGGGTVIQAPALSAPVEAQLDGIDIRRHLVTVSRFRCTDLPSLRRETVRVRLKKPLRVIILAGKGEATPGVIHDISLGGCRVSTGHNSPQDSEIEVELDLDGQRMRIPAQLLRVEGETPAYMCTVIFKHGKESERFISIFIHKRELEIMKELRTTL